MIYYYDYESFWYQLQLHVVLLYTNLIEFNQFDTYFYFQEYPNRSEQADIIHNIDLVESFDKALMKTNTELVSSHSHSYRKTKINKFCRFISFN